MRIVDDDNYQKMIDVEKIKIVHVEASSRCNSHCPMCSRFDADGFVQKDLTEENLSPEIFYKLFTKDFSRQLDHVYFSGVYGDPCINKHLPEFVDWLLDNGCKSISIDTNGGYRNEQWWEKLARPGVLINFSIDGTDDDTLQKYRMGVSYEKLISNVKAFLRVGGQAQWNFIVFRHNEHQIETAEQLAKELGMKFRIKVTQKFRSYKNYKVIKSGVHVFTLEPPLNEKYRHPNVGESDHQPIQFLSFNLKKYQHLEKNKVNCKSLDRKEIFLSASGLVFPCCYLGTYIHNSPGSYQFNQLYNTSDFDLKTNSLESVILKMYEIKDLWDSTIDEGNLITCLSTCGDKNTTLYYTDKLSKQEITEQ